MNGEAGPKAGLDTLHPHHPTDGKSPGCEHRPLLERIAEAIDIALDADWRVAIDILLDLDDQLHAELERSAVRR